MHSPPCPSRQKGVVALLAAKIVGPRAGRFSARDQPPNELRGHSSALSALGTFLLTVGWLGFNLGSIQHISLPGAPRVAAHTAVCTSLSGSAGSLAALGVMRCRHPRPSHARTTPACLVPGPHGCPDPDADADPGPDPNPDPDAVCERGVRRTRGAVWSLEHALNGWLAGLVSITACASAVDTLISIVIGALGGLLYVAASHAAARVTIVRRGLRRAGRAQGGSRRAQRAQRQTFFHPGRSLRTSSGWTTCSMPSRCTARAAAGACWRPASCAMALRSTGQAH